MEMDFQALPLLEWKVRGITYGKENTAWSQEELYPLKGWKKIVN